MPFRIYMPASFSIQWLMYFPLRKFISWCIFLSLSTHMHDGRRVKLSLSWSLKNLIQRDSSAWFRGSQDAGAFSQVTLWLATSSLCPRILSAPRGWPYLTLPRLLCCAPSSDCVSSRDGVSVRSSCIRSPLCETAMWPAASTTRKIFFENKILM